MQRFFAARLPLRGMFLAGTRFCPTACLSRQSASALQRASLGRHSSKRRCDFHGWYVSADDEVFVSDALLRAARFP